MEGLKLVAFLLACLAPLAVQGANPLSKIKIKGQWFVDQDDRVVIFHGINVVAKQFPWVPNYGNQKDLTNDTILQNFKEWGFNSLRLGFMWSGLFPEKGKMNQTYVDEMTQIVDKLASYDIYVILEMHQDMMSTKFDAYDGVPLWVVNDLPEPKHPYPWPFKKIDLGFAAYVTDACGFAFQCLYNNVSNFETHFQDYWRTVAKIFKDKPSVLSYELINEPWAGDVWAEPEIFLPGFAGRFNLMPLYERVYPEIRRIDPETIVMYEPVTWGMMSNGSVLGSGFDHPLGYDPERTALSWHYYCWLLQFSPDPIKNQTYPIFDKVFCDDWQLYDYYKTVQQDAKQHLGNGPTFLTEFGVCAFPVPNKTDVYNMDECEYILEANDKFLQSWTYWDSNFYYYDTDEINYQIVDVFSRVYPMATNGQPVAMSYNLTTQDFVYVYDLNVTSARQASLQTEIFIPKHVYPSGVRVSVPSFLKWTYDQTSNRVLIDLADEIRAMFLQDKKFFLAQQVEIRIAKN